MVVVASAALLLRFAIVHIIKFSISYNESNAAATLKLISTAFENYAKDHLGAFPTDFSQLVEEDPPYLDKNYIAHSPVRGYNYSCSRVEQSGYNCTALPIRCNLTGKTIYTITTGGIFVSEACSKKE